MNCLKLWNILNILGKTLKNKNCIREEIKSRVTSRHAYYHSVQNILSLISLSRNTEIKIHRTVILPVVLYGCEVLSLILREKHRLRMFKNRVLQKITGPKRDGETEGWRRLHNGELRDLYISPNMMWVNRSKRMKWVGHVACTREKRNAHGVFVGRPEGKKQLEKPWHRRDDNIKMDIQEVGCGGMD